MAVNSISSSPIKKSVDGRVFVPGEYYRPYRKVELMIDSTLTDISDYVKSISVSANADARSWSSNVVLVNKNGYFTDKIENDAVIKIYYDFQDATTQQFEGTVKKYSLDLSTSGRFVTLTSYDYTYDLHKIFVWKSYTSAQTGDYIIKDIIDTYTTGFTYTNVDAIADTLAPKFVGQSVMDCLRTVAEYCGCYLFLKGNTFKDFYFFKKTGAGRQNSTEYVAYAMNLISLNNIFDSTTIRNKIYASGARIDGLPNLTTVSTGSSDKEDIYNDNLAYTNEQLIVRATQRLNELSAEKNMGRGRCIGLVNQIPGYELRVVSPYDGVNGWKDIVSFTTTLNEQGLLTSFNYAQRPSDLSTSILELNDKAKGALKDIQEEGMQYSINYTFDSSSDIDPSSSNVTNITSNNNEKTELAVISGSTGTWISPSSVLSFTPTECMIKTNADYKTDNCKFYVAFTASNIWESVNLKEVHTIINAGRYPRIKVIMNNDSTDRIPRFDSIALLYK